MPRQGGTPARFVPLSLPDRPDSLCLSVSAGYTSHPLLPKISYRLRQGLPDAPIGERLAAGSNEELREHWRQVVLDIVTPTGESIDSDKTADDVGEPCAARAVALFVRCATHRRISKPRALLLLSCECCCGPCGLRRLTREPNIQMLPPHAKAPPSPTSPIQFLPSPPRPARRAAAWLIKHQPITLTVNGATGDLEYSTATASHATAAFHANAAEAAAEWAASRQQTRRNEAAAEAALDSAPVASHLR